MRVALVRYHDDNKNTRLPESLRNVMGVLPHLGLGYIASNLRKHGHEVKVIDAQIEQMTVSQFRDALKDFDAQLVGITAYTPTMLGALEAAEVAYDLGMPVVLGGPHTEVFAEENFYHDCITYVCVGEGETFMVELCDALENNKDLKNIKGICFRTKEGGIYRNKLSAKVENLDELPWPERNREFAHKYNSVIALHPVTTMMSMRGCPYKCGFCFKQSIDEKMRYRSPKDIVEEMGYVQESLGVKEIMFYDDTFTLSNKHVAAICDEIRKAKLKIKFEAPTRVNCVNEDMLKNLSDAGCRMLRFGIESGDPDIQKLMMKENDLENIEKVLGWSKKYGIKTFSYFIVGYLGETKVQFLNTVDFVKRMKNLDIAMFTVATPLPGTLLFYQSVRAGKMNPDYWSDYIKGKDVGRIEFLVPDGDLRAKYAYQQFYYRPRAVINNIGSIRSWDEIKKHAQAAKSVLGFQV